ncbi:MAG: hypothetical protein KI793_18875 [Rivularia sp. (in: Bacteria)]|nr:hypothetical protein [Rivularia sp. MS3]
MRYIINGQDTLLTAPDGKRAKPAAYFDPKFICGQVVLCLTQGLIVNSCTIIIDNVLICGPLAVQSTNRAIINKPVFRTNKRN